MKNFRGSRIVIVYITILLLLVTSFMPPNGTVKTVEAASAAKLNKTKLTIEVGKTYQLKVSGTSHTVVWSCNNKFIASVSSKGKVTAKQKGITSIIAKVDDKNLTCKVTVIEPVTELPSEPEEALPTVEAPPEEVADPGSGTGAYNLAYGETIYGKTYTSTKANENAIRAEDSITASMVSATVTKPEGGSTSNASSDFLGLNSAVLALKRAFLNITGCKITAEADGANGIFASDGATIIIRNSTVDVSGENAGGIGVAGGGIMIAYNMTVNSKTKAAIRSDRGGGIMTVNSGKFTTSGALGAPAVYCTADISINDATLTAQNSEAIVAEGISSLTLNNCIVTGNMNGDYGVFNKERIHNVMLYQNKSGDKTAGNTNFTMLGGSLTSQNGDMFYVTNTNSTIQLNYATLSLPKGAKLLVVEGNDGSKGWGTLGSNGGSCKFQVSNETLSGDICVDSISKLKMTIGEYTYYTGAINPDRSSAEEVSVTIDSRSTWTLTGDSFITEFNGSMSNVKKNGYKLFVKGVEMF